MTNETTAQKIARLKALREARDGTPEQIAAVRKQRIAIQKAVRIAESDVILRRVMGMFVQHVGGEVSKSLRDFING